MRWVGFRDYFCSFFTGLISYYYLQCVEYYAQWKLMQMYRALLISWALNRRTRWNKLMAFSVWQNRIEKKLSIISIRFDEAKQKFMIYQLQQNRVQVEICWWKLVCHLILKFIPFKPLYSFCLLQSTSDSFNVKCQHCNFHCASKTIWLRMALFVL